MLRRKGKKISQNPKVRRRRRRLRKKTSQDLKVEEEKKKTLMVVSKTKDGRPKIIRVSPPFIEKKASISGLNEFIPFLSSKTYLRG